MKSKGDHKKGIYIYTKIDRVSISTFHIKTHLSFTCKIELLGKVLLDERNRYVALSVIK